MESLNFHTYDADLAERVMGKTVISVEAEEAGDAIIEDWDLTPRLGEISAPTLIASVERRVNVADREGSPAPKKGP